MTLATNENNDIYQNELGNIETSNDITAVLTTAKSAVQTVLGEMIYKKSDGVPYFETLWNGSPNFQQIESSIRTSVLRVSGVNNINSYDYTSKDNIFSYNIEIETDFGAETLEGSLNV